MVGKDGSAKLGSFRRAGMMTSDTAAEHIAQDIIDFGRTLYEVFTDSKWLCPCPCQL